MEFIQAAVPDDTDSASTAPQSEPGPEARVESLNLREHTKGNWPPVANIDQ
jgi:hypothetical protein